MSKTMITGVIIGNGPSLNKIPRSLLEKYPTIGSNLIYLLDGFTPTYYTAVDPSVARLDYYERISQMQCIKIVEAKLAPHIDNCVAIRTNYCNRRFSKDLFSLQPNEGWSVTYINLQLAYYLKWDVVLLVGVDHHYEGQGNDHFHPDYEIGWTFGEHDMTKALPYYERARKVYTDAGRRIINLTEGSHLDVFEFGNVEDWL